MARKVYNVLMVRQGQNPVCWLACATMLVQFKRNMTPTSEYMGIADADFRGPVSVPSYGAEEWSRLRNLGFVNARWAQLGLSSQTPSPQTILEMLQRHGPFILHHHCGSFWYGPGIPVPRTGGHSVLVVGIDTDRGDVYFHNPWGQTNVPTTASSIVGAINRWETNPANFSLSYM